MTLVSSKEFADAFNDEASDLAEAKERASDENASADDFIRFLRGTAR